MGDVRRETAQVTRNQGYWRWETVEGRGETLEMGDERGEKEKWRWK